MKPLLVSPERIDKLWRQLGTLPWGQEDFASTFDVFNAMLLHPRNLFFELAGGFVTFLDVQPHQGAIIKIAMLDKQLRGREPIIHDLITEVLEEASLKRLTALVPEELRVLQKLYMRLGFRHEGKMRAATTWGSDLHIYGLLSVDNSSVGAFRQGELEGIGDKSPDGDPQRPKADGVECGPIPPDGPGSSEMWGTDALGGVVAYGISRVPSVDATK